MDILRTFKLLDKEIILNIQGTLEEPLFQASQIGKILDMKNIHESIKDFDIDEKSSLITHTQGGLQSMVYLTEVGLYRLINRSKKPSARPFQKWICNIIKELRINGEYKLKDNLNNSINNDLLQLAKDNERHITLIKSMHNENVIYICKLRRENEKFLIKVGSSQNIKERISHIANAFENIDPRLIDVVKCANYVKYEKFLHNNDFFKKFNHPIPNKQGIISKETYLVTEEIIEEMVKIINSNIMLFDNENILEIEKLKLKQEEIKYQKEEIKQKQCEVKQLNMTRQKELELEIKKMELELLKDETIDFKEVIQFRDRLKNIEETLQTIKNPNENEKNISETSSIHSDDDDIDETTIYFSSKKMKCGIKSPLVYQYNLTDLTTPIKIYESPSEVERCKELSHLEISPCPLRNASKNNTIYKGFRWYFVKRDEEPPQEIPPTVELKYKEFEIKYVAMIDITKTKILAVYTNQKEATKARLMKCNSFHRAIQNGTISSGHYWNYFDKCSKEMQDEYLKNNKLPEKYSSPCGKKVQQFCPKTKQLLKVYDSCRDVIKLFKMSVTSLKKYNESGEIHNGYIWKIIDE
jgi:prophage antirepressor-like protein